MIFVHRPWLPDINKYKKYIDGIYERNYLTNSGPLLRELESKLAEHLGVRSLVFVANGTLALQVAYMALDVEGSAVTSPFSFAATVGSLAWQRIEPSFADIDSGAFNMAPENIKAAIKEDTTAIVPVHVFGNPCDVEQIFDIAESSDLKVIYDGAHAFGVNYKDKSLLSYGDATTLSFHATKLFHTIEGGAIVFADPEIETRARQMINFGIDGPDSIGPVGTNAKMNEFEAAMGLCVLDEIDTINAERSRVYESYFSKLSGFFDMQKRAEESTNNHSYFPILFENESLLKEAVDKLQEKKVVARRYFYPSLDSLSYVKTREAMHKSRDIASRILALPMFPQLLEEEVAMIADTVKEVIG